MKPIQLTTIQFPEIRLQTRDAHKLRGYFGHLFKEHSPLLHNHYQNGEFRQSYPLVQYKVLAGVPTLMAIEEGAELMIRLFMQIKQLKIGDQNFEIHNKNISSRKAEIGYVDELKTYTFQTLWLALNQENYRKYCASDPTGRSTMLNRILTGHVLSFYKHVEHFLEPNQRLLVKANVEEKSTHFKDQKMIAFRGSFLINALLPDDIGIGKAVSRGFGTIKAA